MEDTNLPKLSNQIIGNRGLFYACYELSNRGWNCNITSRNAKGVDIVIYNQDAKKMHTIQVKTLAYKNVVPFGRSESLIADFCIICVLNANPKIHPEIYILDKREVQERFTHYKGRKDGKINHYLPPAHYKNDMDRWEIIGNGFE